LEKKILAGKKFTLQRRLFEYENGDKKDTKFPSNLKKSEDSHKNTKKKHAFHHIPNY
jgi:hypothetical protein